MIERDYHMGHYLVFNPTETYEEKWEETRCTNSECERHNSEQDGDWKFCPSCASKIDWLPVIETKLITFRNYRSIHGSEKVNGIAFEDWVWEPEYILRTKNKNANDVKIDKNTAVILPNRRELCDIEDEETFSNHPIVKFLMEHLGKDNFTVCYGVVDYEY